MPAVPRFKSRPSARSLAAPTTMLLAAVLLAGCSQMPGQSASTLPVDPGDPCGTQRSEFAQSKTFFTDRIVTDTLMGAGLGAVAGVALALVTHSNVATAAAIGAGTGAVVGGTSAYAKNLEQKSRDQAEMAQHMNDDLTKEGAEIDHTAASFSRLRQCRFQQAALIKEQVHGHALTREQGLARIGVERGRFDQELNLAHEYGLSMAKRGSQFQDAADALTARPAPPAAQSSTKLAAVAASVSIPEKRGEFDKSVAAAESSSKVAFDLDATAKLTLRTDGARPV